MSIYVVKRDLDAVATKAGTETLTTGIWVIEMCGDTSLVASKIFPVFPSKRSYFFLQTFLHTNKQNVYEWKN